MSFTIRILDCALEQLRALPRKAQRQIARRIGNLASDPRPPGAVRLRDPRVRRLWRVRMGDYRIIYQVRRRQLVVVIVRVGHRKDVYRHLP